MPRVEGEKGDLFTKGQCPERVSNTNNPEMGQIQDQG